MKRQCSIGAQSELQQWLSPTSMFLYFTVSAEMSWNGRFLFLSLFVAVETGTFEIVFKDILFLDALLGFHLLFSEMSRFLETCRRNTVFEFNLGKLFK